MIFLNRLFEKSMYNPLIGATVAATISDAFTSS
jgi:hypothetical protein